MHSQPISARIDWLFEHARRHSVEFVSPDAQLARQRYLALHPTAIVALKCMDGRINLPLATETPSGIVRPFRNLGGMFNLGWPHLGEVLAEHVREVVAEGRRMLVLVTYHFSRSDARRGCAGFDYDTAAAREHTFAIREQIEYVFGPAHETVYPLVCGFETDSDALILHGMNGAELDLSRFSGSGPDGLARAVAQVLPGMPSRIRADLMPLVEGNLRHVAKLRNVPRRLDVEHREWMICVGRGFDFLNKPNLGLIIGPYSPDLADPIRKAAGIIESNMSSGRIPDDGFLLLASAPYSEPGMDRARAELKARFLGGFAVEVISASHPALADRMTRRTAVLDWHSRRLDLVAH